MDHFLQTSDYSPEKWGSMRNISKPLCLGLVLTFASACQVARPERPTFNSSGSSRERDQDPKISPGSTKTSNSDGTSQTKQGSGSADPSKGSDGNPGPGMNTTPKDPVMDGKDPDASKEPDRDTNAGSVPPKLSLLFTGNNQGQISVYKFDRSTGGATLLKANSFGGKAPTFLAFDAKNKRVFSVNEMSDGGLMSFSLDPASGTMNVLSNVSFPSGATHVGLDPSAKYIFGASYNGHRVYSFSIGNDGKIGPQISSEGSGMNSHQAMATTNAVFVPALSSNHIAMYSMANGQLTSTGTLPVPGGPRHMAIHPNGKWAYVLTENAQTVLALDVNGAKLTAKGNPISALTTAASGFAAEIHVHPNGKFVYASLRGSDQIASFAVNGDGTLKLLKNAKTGGQWPRHFSIDSSGQWLFVANQMGGGVTIFKIDATSGDISKQSATVAAQGPQFVELIDFND